MKYYISHYRLNQPFCFCMHNSFMSLSGGHLNGVLLKSPGSVYIEGIGTASFFRVYTDCISPTYYQPVLRLVSRNQLWLKVDD